MLIINKPFKDSPFLAGFPSTPTHYNLSGRNLLRKWDLSIFPPDLSVLLQTSPGTNSIPKELLMPEVHMSVRQVRCFQNSHFSMMLPIKYFTYLASVSEHKFGPILQPDYTDDMFMICW